MEQRVLYYMMHERMRRHQSRRARRGAARARRYATLPFHLYCTRAGCGAGIEREHRDATLSLPRASLPYSRVARV